MKYAFLAISIFVSCLVYTQTREIVELWPNKVPGETKSKQVARQTDNTSGNVVRLTDITNPNLTIFKPKQPNNSKAGIIICPGGGYNILAIDKEGYEVAEWLNSLGYTAFVLQYRVPKNRLGALQDVQRAIKWVRKNASRFKLNDKKIGIMGFSAGGHLSANVSTYTKETYQQQDSIDGFSSRSNFSILIYPAYLDKGENGSLSPEIKINEFTPPFFIFGTNDDPYSNSAFVLSSALKDNKIPLELHMLANGGHGYGLRKGNLAAETWPLLVEKWLLRVLIQEKVNR